MRDAHSVPESLPFSSGFMPRALARTNIGELDARFSLQEEREASDGRRGRDSSIETRESAAGFPIKQLAEFVSPSVASRVSKLLIARLRPSLKRVT